jgi:uncharacterized membrane protein YhaH (DUF805 family)
LKGNVIGFDPDTNTGAISGHDGQRYDFTTSDWHSHARPKHGDLVDFVAEQQRAAQIYPIEPEYIAPSFGEFYFSPSGRISRSQYWLKYVVPVVVIGIILSFLQIIGGEGFQVLSGLFQLLVLWPGIALLIKRIHDRNKSGWLVWVLYGPLIVGTIFTIAAVVAIALGSGEMAALGIISGVVWIAVVVVAIWFFIEFGCMRGTVGANQYGPDPVPRS